MNMILLSNNDVKQCITMQQAINAMESTFLQLAHNQVIMPLRTLVGIESENAVSLTMPAYLTKELSLGVKIVSSFPNNLSKNIPTINGIVLLLDAITGEAKALIDASYLTALRTGAVSGLATKYFARDDAKHVAIIGSGAQAYAQLEAVSTVRDIHRVSVWSRHIDNAKHFVNQIEQKFDIKAYDKITDAVKDADIICTATNSTEPLIRLSDIKEAAHINAIGSHSKSMCELNNDIFSRAVIIVDQIEAAMSEAGEIISALDKKIINKNALNEIGHLLMNKQTDYKNQLTVFKSVGLAIQDISVAAIVYNNAIKKRLGQQFQP